MKPKPRATSTPLQTAARTTTGQTSASATTGSQTTGDNRRQVNTRLPRDLVTAVDTRRSALGLSRDEWVRRALAYVLTTTDGNPLHITARRTTGRRPPF